MPRLNGRSGFRCPQCDEVSTRVLESHSVKDAQPSSLRRRRECNICKIRFTTYETVRSVTPIFVVKRNKTIEAFNRDKLTRSMRVALFKRNITEERLRRCIDGIINVIDEWIETRGRTGRAIWRKEKRGPFPHIRVSSQRIGELVMNSLRLLDVIGYIRYASVFLRFYDPDHYLALIEELKAPPTDGDQ